jgi:hypothetical protein
MNEMEAWLYSGDEEVYNKSVIESRGKNLNDLGTTVYKRYFDWGKLGEALYALETATNGQLEKLSLECEKQKKGEVTYITQQDFEEINKKINDSNTLLNSAREQYSSFPRFAEPPVRFESIEKAVNELNNVNLILI